MPRVGFEPTIPLYEPAKAVHASDRAASVIGTLRFTQRQTDCFLYIATMHTVN
jgi:hypothetical protein